MTAIVLDLPVGTQVGGARIAMAAAVLDWDEASGNDIHRDFVLLLGDRLGAVLSVLPDARGERLKESLAALPDEGWLRLLTSPRASYQLLWPSRHSPVDIAEFLESAIAAEQARARSMGVAAVSQIYPTDEKRWSALGDGWLDDDGAFVSGPALQSFPPIDVASPHALAIDIEGEVEVIDGRRQPLARPEIANLLARLADTRDRLIATDPALCAFVADFTKVLVLQPDPEAPSLFSTGSSAQFVGRSVFGNPSLATVDSVLLADGLVHEAIHSLLYMSERLEPWVLSPELYGPELRTRSGWSGNPLPLRSYLQACFVWYGLATFWGRAVAEHSFPADHARARLEHSLRGFLTGHVLDQVQPYRDGINGEILAVIDHLQADIVSAL